MSGPVFELKCKLQNYPTGKTGLDGLAAQLAHKSQSHEFTLDEKKQYAELWMGSHENGPASLQDGTPLQKHVDSDPEYFMGKSMLEKFKGDSSVPFLFKILTARKALQLQIHPDKKAAAQLHKENPDEFKDTNHKPEIALAVKECEIFAGFRPPKVINNLLSKIPELVEIFGVKDIPEKASKDAQTEELKKILSVCFNMADSTKAYEKLMSSSSLAKFSQEKDLLKRANEMYPGDAGAFIVVFLMNYFILKPGEAAYVKENGIHAWFTGDMIECMANSDNVINAGFMPKEERAKEDFLRLIRYDQAPIDDHHVHSERYGKASSGNTIVYDPPIEEFSILKTELSAGEKEMIQGVDGPGILICTKGSALLSFEKDSKRGDVELNEGHVFFVAAGTTISYAATSDVQIFEAISGEMMNRKGDIKE